MLVAKQSNSKDRNFFLISKPRGPGALAKGSLPWPGFPAVQLEDHFPEVRSGCVLFDSHPVGVVADKQLGRLSAAVDSRVTKETVSSCGVSNPKSSVDKILPERCRSIEVAALGALTEVFEGLGVVTLAARAVVKEERKVKLRLGATPGREMRH